jgi:hypothetical protein
MDFPSFLLMYISALDDIYADHYDDESDNSSNESNSNSNDSSRDSDDYSDNSSDRSDLQSYHSDSLSNNVLESESNESESEEELCDENIKCRICMKKQIALACEPCHHLICFRCSSKINNKCPFCKQNTTDFVFVKIKSPCLICLTKIPDIMFMPCQCSNTCNDCYIQSMLKNNIQTCSTCNKSIDTTETIYNI